MSTARYTLREAADLTDLSICAIRRRYRAGKLPGAGPDPQDPTGTIRIPHEALARLKRKHLPLALVRDIAAHLPAVQQLALWFERILGVRIGEGFGPFVGDVVDFGDVAGRIAGCVVIDKQGGRPFQVLEDGGHNRASAKQGAPQDKPLRPGRTAPASACRPRPGRHHGIPHRGTGPVRAPGAVSGRPEGCP